MTTTSFSPSSPTQNQEEDVLVPSEVLESQLALDALLAPTDSKRVRNDYTALSKQIKAEGLLERAVGFYVRKFLSISLLVLAAWAAIFFLRDTWFVLALAPILGLLTAQYGFLAHEASHQQIFRSPKLNKQAGILLADGFAGLAYGWWMIKHSKHHANPNQVKKDPDVDISVLSFSPGSLNEKKGLEGWLARRQGWLFFPLLTLTTIGMLGSSFKALFSKNVHIQHRKTEILLLAVRQLGFIALILFLFSSPWIAVVFWFLAMMSFGVFMGGAFAPNHKGMPMVPKASRIDFLRRQVLTSRNIKGKWLVDNLMGGLNYQIEHHLFPSMPRPHLRRASEITKAYCASKKIPYYQTSLVGSYRIVVRYLNRVGMAAADPFDCPTAGQLRMGG